jgi:hypothetical protein
MDKINIIKETPYLRFALARNTGKTKVIWVVNIHHDEIIGIIKWFGRWRQYCFFPENQTIWNIDCLNDVNAVIKSLMDERKTKKI